MKIGNKEIEVVRGDITEATTEAIVNAANNHLWMGAGVAGAIKRKGGIEIEQEAVSKGPIKVGEAVITGAGKLKAKYVIHAAGMGQDLRTDAQGLRQATKSSLQLTEDNRISSVSFPAIGTGVGGFPVEECAEIMIEEAMEFLQKSRHLQEVVFVLFDEGTASIFQSTLQSLAKSARAWKNLSPMKYGDHITHYRLDAELFDYFDEGAGATKEFDRRLRSYVLHLCKVRPGSRVLDVGSGSGWMVRKLAAGNIRTVCVDLSERNLARVKNEVDRNFADFVLADAYRLPFRDNSFDLVVAAEVLEHLESPAAGVRELQRLLAPGGKLAASTPYEEKIQYYLCIHCNKKTPANAHLHSFDERSLNSLFRSQNFADLRFYKVGNKFLLYTRIYYLLRFLPFRLWKILDRIANSVIRKPAHITAIAERN